MAHGLSLVPGYFVLETFSSVEEVKRIHDYMVEFIHSFDGSSSSIFYTIKGIWRPWILETAKGTFNKVGHENVSNLFYSLRYKRPAVIQSMYIFKQPCIGGEEVPHQDNTFGIPLCRASIMRRVAFGQFLDHIKSGTHFDHPSPTYVQKEFVPLEVKSGALMVIHGDLIHQSFEKSLSSVKTCSDLTLHVVDNEGCEWSKQNWLVLQRKTTPEPLYAK
ncbi:hypothetical protein ABZP36_019935 [Zizania latifolia]